LSGDVRLTWLGNTTVLLELDGARVLTDPVLRRGPFRRGPPEVGRLDAVLVSPAHRDRLDRATLRRLDPASAIVAPRGGVRGAVHELGPGDELELAGLRVRAAPPGYVVAGSIRVYFGGTSEPPSALDGSTDVALLSIASPRRAAEAVMRLRPARAIPLDAGRRRRRVDPIAAFVANAAELTPDVRVDVIEPGGSLELPARIAPA
jgi:L-ascorbate metabolism protein UlaG (beta-lactamase superfamily)